ncbi:hypothetical protein NDU88_004165 [Pleurodeles waltl]|uniref:Secreted protein n=1 Tax=Pleurodeles waltl TaxID=8319 RepID=A0AAV7SI02_PLEWA|nr:hypothetical protein NDU88_004165 [Pleurodeles waltl]
MHCKALVQSPTPLLQLLLSFFLRGSPGLSNSAPRREQREVKRLPRRTPLAASAHTLESDVRFQHRSSATFVGVRAFPSSFTSPAVVLVILQSRRYTARKLCSSSLRYFQSGILLPDTGATASQRTASHPSESSRTGSLAARHVPPQNTSICFLNTCLITKIQKYLSIDVCQ